MKDMSEGAEKMMGIVREQSLLHELLDGALRKQKVAAMAAAVAENVKRDYLR